MIIFLTIILFKFNLSHCYLIEKYYDTVTVLHDITYRTFLLNNISVVVLYLSRTQTGMIIRMTDKKMSAVSI